jgi:hypothetical protein
MRGLKKVSSNPTTKGGLFFEVPNPKYNVKLGTYHVVAKDVVYIKHNGFISFASRFMFLHDM